MRHCTKAGDSKWTERSAVALHAASVVGALGVCATQAHVYPVFHILFASCFFFGSSVAAVLHSVVDCRLGNTCSPAMRRFRIATSAVAFCLVPVFNALHGEAVQDQPRLKKSMVVKL